MLLVKTYLDRSPIHGLGVFAGQFIRKGTRIWRFVEGFDRAYTPEEFSRLPKPAREFIRRHGYRVDGEILLTADHDHHMNHSDDPNTYLRDGYAIARRHIRKGEEITNDYREFDLVLCAAFLRDGPPSKPARRKGGRTRPRRPFRLAKFVRAGRRWGTERNEWR